MGSKGPKSANSTDCAITSRKKRSWSRARRPEQKEARRAAILAAAVALLDEGGIEAASLSAIARRSKISKANLYRYFESREAILLTVTVDEFAAWIADLTAGLEAIDAATPEAIADVLTNAFVDHPRLTSLIPSLSSVLEHNVGAEAVATFKRSFTGLTEAPVNALAALLPRLDVESAHRLLSFVYVFVAGLQPMAHPPPAVATVLEDPEFEHLAIEFAPSLRAHTLLLLRGLLAGDSPPPDHP